MKTIPLTPAEAEMIQTLNARVTELSTKAQEYRALLDATVQTIARTAGVTLSELQESSARVDRDDSGAPVLQLQQAPKPRMISPQAG